MLTASLSVMVGAEAKTLPVATPRVNLVSTAKKPVVIKKPVVKKPVIKKPIVQKPVIKKSVVKKPAPPRLNIIRGELSGTAPDKTELNVKSSNKRYDYTVLLDENTVYVGKDKATTTIEDFGFGDVVEVGGKIEKPYTIRAKTVRDLSAWKVPVKVNTLTVKELSLSDGEIVAMAGPKEWRVKVEPQTVLMNSDRTTITINDINVNDTIYVAGVWDQRVGVILATVVQKK